MATTWHNLGAKDGLYVLVQSDKGDSFRLAFTADAVELVAYLNRLESMLMPSISGGQ